MNHRLMLAVLPILNVALCNAPLVADQKGAAAKLIRGAGRSGLAFRLLWFEREDPANDAAITEFRFPIGCDYDSQEIHRANAVQPGGEVREDEHGNLVLSYAEPIAIGVDQPVVLGYVNDVTIFPQASLQVDSRKIRKGSRIPQSIESAFLRDEEVFGLADPGLLEVAASLQQGCDDPLELVYRTWNFVYQSLRYDSVQRPNTAADVLQWKKGQCGEFSKLTIALLRANGIPARGVWSLRSANTGPMHNDHAWAEAYLPGVGWCPIQPQTEPTGPGEFRLDYNSYLIVCRPAAGMEPYRALSFENASNSTGSRGAGFFADVPEGDRKESVELFQAIAGDPQGRKAARHLEQSRRAHREVQPMLFWALAASAQPDAGAAAAAELVALCQDASRKLDLARFLAVSPALIQQRVAAVESSSSRSVR